MTKSGNKKKNKLRSSLSAEASYSAEGKRDKVLDSERLTAMATNEGVNEAPSLVDVRNVLTEMKPIQ